MRFVGVSILLLASNHLFATDAGNLELFFKQVSKLEFESAVRTAANEKHEPLRLELLRFAGILYNAGQVPRQNFLTSALDNELDDDVLIIIRKLSNGYLSLFYDQLKGSAYKEFYSAYQLAREIDDDVLMKACVTAMLEYYRSELAQVSDNYLPYLDQFQAAAQDTIDRVWYVVYRAIFYAKSFNEVDSAFFRLEQPINNAILDLPTNSPVRSLVFFQKAQLFEAKRDLGSSTDYYLKSVESAKDYKFLRNIRFSSYLKLILIASRTKDFKSARDYWSRAKIEMNLADTLRTSYFLTLYRGLMLNEERPFDSAFALLARAFVQGYELDFRRNTLEINRLNVELGTQEKENDNLQLKQDRNLLGFGMAGLGLLGAIGFLAYRNQRARNRIELQQKEMHSMELERLLQEQEIAGIDHMIEAQEKERQRIANELHDNLGSHLASIKLYFESFQSRTHDPESNMLFNKTRELLEEAYQKVRTLAHARNVGVNSKDGLMPAVRSLATRISNTNMLKVNIEEHGMDAPLENSVELLLFRIIQELVTNVIKYANASEVDIHLTRHENSINLMVEDDGVGFDALQMKHSETMGLHSIQKRVEHLGGTVAIDSVLNSGTSIIIDLPL